MALSNDSGYQVSQGRYKGKYGVIEINSKGGFSYSLSVGLQPVGVDLVEVFDYSLFNESASVKDDAKIFITIKGTRDAYVEALDDRYDISESDGYLYGNLLKNDYASFIYGVPASQILLSGHYGDLEIDVDGSFSYHLYDRISLKDGEKVVDVFSYTAENTAGRDDAKIYINIHGVLDFDVDAIDDEYSFSERDDYRIDGNVLMNDHYDTSRSDGLKSVRIDGKYGKILFYGDGRFSYQLKDFRLKEGEVGVDVFDYQLFSVDDSDSAQLVIKVVGHNFAPSIQRNIYANYGEIESGKIQVYDQDQDAWSVILNGSKLPKGFTLSKDGSYTFDTFDIEYRGYLGGDTKDFSFMCEVLDAEGAVGKQEITIMVSTPNNGLSEYVDQGERLGTSANDRLIGQGKSVTLFGFSGHDDLFGGEENDTLDGGSDQDILHGEKGADLLYGGSGMDKIYGGDGDDSVSGGSSADILYGGRGEDLVSAGSGHDQIYGGEGRDELYGHNGQDVIYGDEDSDFVHAGSKMDQVFGGVGEDKIDGGSGEDLLDGGSESDTIYGGSGNDEIYGGEGQDLLFGTSGDDFIYAGSENDTLDGGTGNDDLVGQSGEDRLLGFSGQDNIYGGKDADYLDGGDDKDYLYGGSGDDLIFAGNGDDFLDGGMSTDKLYGDSGVDLLLGNLGNDFLYGGEGSDILNGEGGLDVLVGGHGSDNYLFVRGSNTDVVSEQGFDTDRITFAQDIHADQLWFSRQGKHLAIQVIGSTDDIVMVRNWYEGASNQVEQIKSGDGLKISHSQVQVLVDAMASLSPPAVGRTTLDAATQQQLAVALGVWS